MKDNRKAALNAGDMHYFTGVTCLNGHVAKRLTNNASCLLCEAKRVREARKKKARIKRLKRTVAEARVIKARFYFTGKPCRYGHIDIRRTINSLCEACKRKRDARKRELNKVRAESRRPKVDTSMFIFYTLKWVNREKNDVMARLDKESFLDL